LVFQVRELIGIINNSGEFPQAIQMTADGRVDPGPMISNRISLEEVVKKGFEECALNKRANVKVIVNCNEDLREA
jgi:threonine dehydrogenase-like Zn-dependent dehydrogenase